MISTLIGAITIVILIITLVTKSQDPVKYGSRFGVQGCSGCRDLQAVGLRMLGGSNMGHDS